MGNYQQKKQIKMLKNQSTIDFALILAAIILPSLIIAYCYLAPIQTSPEDIKLAQQMAEILC